MQTVFKRIALVAPTAACVLVTGESGSGKELVARAIHANSPRRGKPLLVAHVAAYNPNLVESELFGHVKGAFTGADKARDGLLTLADGGTVFLDELADIPLPVQAKLLRVLERQEVQPVGGSESHTVDVRIVSATHADLSAAVREGTFRHDLFFRLNVYPIHVPPLRDRVDDIPLLADYFLRKFGVANPAGALAADTVAFLKARPWPGMRDIIVGPDAPIHKGRIAYRAVFPASLMNKEIGRSLSISARSLYELKSGFPLASATYRTPCSASQAP